MYISSEIGLEQLVLKENAWTHPWIHRRFGVRHGFVGSYEARSSLAKPDAQQEVQEVQVEKVTILEETAEQLEARG